MQKPSNPKGTRDFGSDEIRKRGFIFEAIKKVFEQFAFQPIETPAFENLSTLTGKYGEEGDKLLFRILNSGDIMSGLVRDALEKSDNSGFINSITKKGLRYDLTVPFARYVVQHSNEIVFPFRRYQIQTVWRADRPGKGRFQEFTQCDADIIGSRSMMNEADLIQIYDLVFKDLGMSGVQLKINHRKLLEALVQELGLKFDVTVFTSSLDKLDKIGESGVRKAFKELNINENQLDKLFSIIDSSELDEEFLQRTADAFNQNEKALEAIEDLRTILKYLENSKLNLELQLDLSLARGLDYYTGCIFEAIVPNSGIGSISGGGRYDDLTGVFGLKDVSGVGISFGIDRIYELMESKDLFKSEQDSDNILLCHFDQDSQNYQNAVAQMIRGAGFKAFVFPDIKKIGKQMDYANKRGIPFVIIAGEDERKQKAVTVKNMITGDSQIVSWENLVDHLNKIIA